MRSENKTSVSNAQPISRSKLNLFCHSLCHPLSKPVHGPVLLVKMFPWGFSITLYKCWWTIRQQATLRKQTVKRNKTIYDVFNAMHGKGSKTVSEATEALPWPSKRWVLGWSKQWWPQGNELIKLSKGELTVFLYAEMKRKGKDRDVSESWKEKLRFSLWD